MSRLERLSMLPAIIGTNDINVKVLVRMYVYATISTCVDATKLMLIILLISYYCDSFNIAIGTLVIIRPFNELLECTVFGT